MSWWKNSEGMILGDVPADALALTLGRVAADRKEDGKPRPTLQELLDAAAAALAARGEKGRRIVGRPSDRSSKAPDKALVAALTAAFAEIEGVYEDELERKPAPGELVATLNFVLGSAGKYLSDPEGVDTLNLSLE